MHKIDYLIGTIIFLSLIFIGGYIDSTYRMEGIITQKGNGGLYEVTDTMGETYIFYGDDFELGQGVKIYFNNNQTENRKDDIIYKVKGV